MQTINNDLNTIMNFFDYIEYTKPYEHFANRYARLLTRYLLVNQNETEIQKFIINFEANKYLKAITYLNKIEKKYKRKGHSFSQSDLQKLLIQFINNYEDLVNAEEDDFDDGISLKTYELLMSTGVEPWPIRT